MWQQSMRPCHHAIILISVFVFLGKGEKRSKSKKKWKGNLGERKEGEIETLGG